MGSASNELRSPEWAEAERLGSPPSAAKEAAFAPLCRKSPCPSGAGSRRDRGGFPESLTALVPDCSARITESRPDSSSVSSSACRESGTPNDRSTAARSRVGPEKTNELPAEPSSFAAQHSFAECGSPPGFGAPTSAAECHQLGRRAETELGGWRDSFARLCRKSPCPCGAGPLRGPGGLASGRLASGSPERLWRSPPSRLRRSPLGVPESGGAGSWLESGAAGGGWSNAERDPEGVRSRRDSEGVASDPERSEGVSDGAA
jgi:hypothetical protein